MKIEGLKENIKNLPLTPKVIKSLRETARFQTIHYSTQIEGNRLTQKEIVQVIKDKEHFIGKQRDENEIKAYYTALEWIERNIHKPITEITIKTIHSIVEGRSKTKPTSYRDGQNVIKDSVTGAIVYLPPEARDVPKIMNELVEWLQRKSSDIPIPIVAAIAHYQLATIHPYYDGNGRTARLLTTLILHKNGYDLKGLYSLEEYYAKDLQAYYKAISIGEHHNYYFGRAEADITPWIEYFISGMFDSFENVKRKMQEALDKGETDKTSILRTYRLY
jgi:Fic family protein